jgi:hypothetical protein
MNGGFYRKIRKRGKKRIRRLLFPLFSPFLLKTLSDFRGRDDYSEPNHLIRLRITRMKQMPAKTPMPRLVQVVCPSLEFVFIRAHSRATPT